MGAPIVRLERIQNGRRLINEVDDHRLRLIREHSVQPRQCLHRLDTREFAINIHRTQTRLVETGLEFIRHNKHLGIIIFPKVQGCVSHTVH